MTEIIHAGVRLRLIPGFDHYYSGEDGFIWSDAAGPLRRLRNIAHAKHRGLRTVTLYREDARYDRKLASGRVKSCVRPIVRYVHRLVALCWLPPQPSPHHEIDHVNEDRADNRPSNLRWLTKAENVRSWLTNHPDRKVLASSGEANPAAKLSAEQVREIRASGERRAVLAGRFGVSKSTVTAVRSGRTWGHVA